MTLDLRKPLLARAFSHEQTSCLWLPPSPFTSRTPLWACAFSCSLNAVYGMRCWWPSILGSPFKLTVCGFCHTRYPLQNKTQSPCWLLAHPQLSWWPPIVGLRNSTVWWFAHPQVRPHLRSIWKMARPPQIPCLVVRPSAGQWPHLRSMEDGSSPLISRDETLDGVLILFL